MKERKEKTSVFDDVLFESKVPGFVPTKLKGRDIYNIGTGDLVVLHADRGSYLNGRLICRVPFKGRLMVRLNLFWLSHFGPMAVPNNFKLTDLKRMPRHFQLEDPQNKKLIYEGRAMLCWNTEPLRYEFIVKGYLAQSDWTEYNQKGTVCGHSVGKGLVLGSKLQEPILAPRRKLRTKPSESVTFDAMANELGHKVATELRQRSLSLYRKAYEYALSRGVIVVSTKFEFGRLIDGDAIMLTDELLTPESTHFCLEANYLEGKNPTRHEIKPIQDWIGTIQWDGKSKLPPLPEKCSEEVSERHVTIASLLLRDTPR